MKTDFEQKCSQPEERCVLVCQHRSCLAAGSAEVLAAFKDAQVKDFRVTGTRCQGQCTSGPTVRILPEETWYWRVKPSDVPIIVEQHLLGGKRIEAKLNSRIHMRYSF